MEGASPERKRAIGGFARNLLKRGRGRGGAGMLGGLMGMMRGAGQFGQQAPGAEEGAPGMMGGPPTLVPQPPQAPNPYSQGPQMGNVAMQPGMFNPFSNQPLGQQPPQQYGG